jgi:hypothetical protein
LKQRSGRDDATIQQFNDSTNQCRCGPPPQQPHEPGVPVHDGASPPLLPPADDAKTESFFERLVEPQSGHRVPFQSLKRTRISLSFSHFPQ